jgi:beta-lactamase regulating signal transducer with metallopeptidase domain
MLQHPVLHAVGVAGWETSSLLNVMAGSTAVLGAAWAGTALMRRSSAARRHLVWCVALGAVLLLPGLSVLLPAWHVLPERFSTAAGGDDFVAGLGIAYSLPPLEIDAPDVASAGAVEGPIAERARRQLSPGAWLLILWATGTVLALLPAVLGRWLLRGVERSCVPASEAEWDLLLRQARRDLGLTQAVTLLLSASRAMPMTWGIRRPRVLLPTESLGWPADRRRVVLLHELGHVKRRDCLTHLLGQVARAVYWFHPLAWVAAWRMQVERERACDDLVLRLGTQQADYAQELVEVTAGLVRSPYAMAGIAMAKPSRLEQRVREILDSRRNRRTATRRHVLVTVALVGLVAVPVAIIKGGGQVQAQTPGADEQEAVAAPVVTTPPPAEPSVPRWDLWSPQATECAQNGYYLHLAVLNYASKHEWRLPPDLGTTLPYVLDYDRANGGFKTVPPAEAAKYYLCPLDREKVAVPAVPTPEWINRNTSYEYLGGADVNVDALTEEQFDGAVITYEKTGGAHPEMAGNPMAFTLRGYDSQPRTAERIAWSRQALDATRGVPFPTEGQSMLAQMGARVQAAPKTSECARNQAEVAKGIVMYINDHRGYYPPTLGDTLKYVKKLYDPVAQQSMPVTPQQAARMYLCSQDQDVEIPEDVTPEWINEHTSFVYLGDEMLTEGADPLAAILYERLDRGHEDVVNLTFADFHVEAKTKDQAQAIIDRSIVMIEDDRARTAQRAAAKAGNQGSGTAPGATASAPSRRPADPSVARLATLRRLLQVLVEDTQERRGRLPGDLVDVFQFATRNRGPKAPPALSPRVAARLLLSPRAQNGLKVPDKPSVEWLREKTSYAYLADDRLTVDLMQAAIPAAQWSEVVVLHEKPVEGDSQVAVATLDLICQLVEAKKASEMIERSKAALATARTATASLTSQPTNQASHPAQRWRGKSADQARQATAAGKGKAETETR